MFDYRKLLEGAKVLAAPNADVLARIQKKPRDKMPSGGRILDIHSEYLFKYNGRWVIDTNHAITRFMQRNQLTTKQLETFFRRMIDKYLSMGPRYLKMNNPEFLFFSKSLNQGMIIAFRRDYKRIDSLKHFIIVTVLPRGKRRPKPGTDVILLEYLKNYHVIEID
jgi:hypothetical protein